MKISTILNNIAVALRADSAINAYCNSKYSKEPTVFVHVDPKNPPSITNAPWIGLTVQAYRYPAETNGHVVEFDIEAALYCSDSGQTTTASGITTLDGFENLEDLSDLVFANIQTSIATSSLQLNTTEVTEQQTSLLIADFPGWIASKVFTVAKHV